MENRKNIQVYFRIVHSPIDFCPKLVYFVS